MSDNISVQPASAVLSADEIGKNKKKHRKERTKAELVADILLWLVRILLIVDIVMLFFPTFNVARISEKINKNISLFTCGTDYDSLISEMGRAFRKEWISESVFKGLFGSCLSAVAAAVIYAVGGCMSLGNAKLKKLGVTVTAAASIINFAALLGINSSYNAVLNCAKPDKISPMEPQHMTVYMVITVALFVLSAVIFFILPSFKSIEHFEMEDKFKLFLMFLPIIILTFLFSYLPLYGWRYAFFEYNAGETLSMDKFVGFKWFTSLFQNSATKQDIIRVLRNTLAMSGLGIATSWLPMVFAVFLSEIKNLKFRRFVQTFTTIPNFISWVLVYAIALAIFNTDGFINTFLTSIGNPSNTNYLQDGSHMWLKMLAWGTWKGLGWSAIIYVAAISGIDQQLYEAATVDGAGRFQKMWYITIPDLIPTYMVLLLMSIANILTNGMDQYLVFSHANNKSTIEVLDLYVYNLGIIGGLIPLSTVIGMVKSVVSVILLFAANGISKLVRGESII